MAAFVCIVLAQLVIYPTTTAAAVALKNVVIDCCVVASYKPLYGCLYV